MTWSAMELVKRMEGLQPKDLETAIGLSLEKWVANRESCKEGHYQDCTTSSDTCGLCRFTGFWIKGDERCCKKCPLTCIGGVTPYQSAQKYIESSGTHGNIEDIIDALIEALEENSDMSYAEIEKEYGI